MVKVLKTETRLLSVQLLFVSGLTIFIILWWFYNYNQNNLFLKASEINNTKITNQVLYSNEQKYLGPLNDNSEWDETVGYIENPTRDFEDECVNTLLETFNINGIWIFDKNGGLVYTINDSTNAKLSDLLSSVDVKSILSKRNPKCHFFLAQDSSVFEIFGATVVPTTDTKHLSDPSGFYFYVKTWDTILIRDFERITGSNVILTLLKPGQQEELDYPPGHVHRQLKDWQERQVGLITFVNHDPIFDEWMRTSKFLVLIYIGIGIIFILVLGYLFRKWISTPLKSTIRELHVSEDRFRQVAESAEEWIWEVDANGLYKYSNSVVEKILGYHPEEVVGKKYFYDFFKPEEAEQLRTRAFEAFSKKEAFRDFINPNLHKNGHTVILETTGTPITDKDGNLNGYRGTDMDITARLQNEKDLIKAKEKAEESDRLKTAFLANMSHEIRTPINGILGFAQLLNDETLSPADRDDYVSIIYKNSHLLLRVIGDIVDIAKIESNQLSINRIVFNLNQLLDRIFLFFKNELKNIGKDMITLSLEKKLEDEQSYIISDDARLEQILNNLLGNAIKFTQSGYIKFGYQIEDGNLIFFVEDSGKGITENKQHIIFERFRQEEEDHTRKYGGSGLGLSISKGLVELLGGKIWMTSESGHGTAFYFRLPFVSVGKPSHDQEEFRQKSESINLKNKIILVVDDNVENFELLRMMLRPTEVKVLYAGNGAEAIEICQKNSDISLVFMDIQMPVMNGYETIVEIRKFRPLIPIVALTAYAFPEDRIRSLNAGCNDILTKPIIRGRLLDMIKKILN